MNITDKTAGLTAEILKSRFYYSAKTGLFTYSKDLPGQDIRAGDLAGYIRDNGYRYICIDNRQYSAHRLVWLYVYGRWPSRLIDHKNGDKGDNRLFNLREATVSQNLSNGKIRSNNTSGFKGVTKCKSCWKAQITHNSQVIYLGLFPTRERAHEAYINTANKLQGEFARAA
jgi:hypothetical protein